MRIKVNNKLVTVNNGYYTYVESGHCYKLASEGPMYSHSYKLSEMQPVTKLDKYLLSIDTEIEALYNEERKGESND